MSLVIDYTKDHKTRFRQQLIDLLSIPSVSTKPEHREDVQRAAQWLADDIERIGMDRAIIFQHGSYLPIVYGEWLGAGEDAPTVLVYGHYDVQPAAMEDGWETDPFTPTERDGKLFARGAVDSKSHVIIQLKAVEALLASPEKSPVNIKLLFEGEEESNSEHIFQLTVEQKKLLKADVCVISDGSMPDIDQPVLIYGLRGIIAMELEVNGPIRDLHSGHYGGSVHNPIQALIEILAQLHDADGRVTVPGFYDDVLSLDNDEREVLARITPLAEVEWKTVAAAPQPWGEPEYSINERIGARPTLEFNGIVGGFAEEGLKTIIPSRALAKISCRLVPNQQPQKIFELVERYIDSITPPTVRANLRLIDNGAPGIVINRMHPALKAVIQAYEQGWGKRPMLTREGGSIPVVAAFQTQLEVPLVFMPFGYKGCRAHGPNEHVIMSMFYRGIDTMIHFYHALAKLHSEK